MKLPTPWETGMIVFLFLVFLSPSARAQSCGDLCAHTPSGGLYTQAIYIAQGFQVTQPSRITAFTVQLQSPTANGTQTLVSAALHADMNGTLSSQPSAQLVNADFNISSPGVVGPGTTQTYYATAGSSAPLLDPGFYWLKLTLPFNLMAWHQASNTYVPDLTGPIRYTKFVSSGSPTDWAVQSTTTTAYLVLTGCYQPLPSPSPSPSPSPYASAAPAVQLLTTDVSASFDDQAPAVNVSATSGSQPAVVSSSFKDIDINGSTLPSDGLGGYTVESSNTTGVGGQVETTTYAYRAQIDASTTIEQSFTFSNTPKPGDFFGSAYVLAAGSVKWSVNLTAATTSGAGSSTSGGVTLRYLLAGLRASNSNSSSANGIVRLTDSPKANMTTYFVQLSAKSVAKVEVFDIAFIDGAGFQYITHDILAIPTTSAPGVAFELVLRFPGFNESLLYDPSLGLGVLVGSSNGESGGSDNSALIVAVAVAVPLAVAVVVVVIAAAIGVAWWRKRRAHGEGVVNFEGGDHRTPDPYQL
ncbi:uncharacterized protein ACA1_376180 [Acanthamoeba castellanii str. Neff]|uniref:Uncharacterized protein n=1 Tax=Acanthamoeba castellanii (strain ATCC 30010 / Neff) TaxID=1257118 RepID=L8HHI7_ACACF|nr:uncharacterized protein ACA1_376180 [Acanthamoeba castellanii str. Neff]ELR24158.1 hypothetical protein ACA1_376180 [Acanthamoeba castellanii str. Neff]